MNIESLTSAKIRTVARLLKAMDEQRATAGLVAARRILDDQLHIIDKAIAEINHLKEQKNMEKTTNETFATHFVNGSDYLSAWKSDQALRREFGDDFLAFCHFKQAEGLGLVRIMQGQQKV